PNLRDCEFPSKSLAGVGVAFYLMLALRTFLRDKGWFDERNIAPPNLAELLRIAIRYLQQRFNSRTAFPGTNTT
ncbi:hypothetical protein KU406_23525, partial [Salmonella enterica subsp. enterica serovar Montevideo]|nr:hypothetical protein [Salmonella enterica subsp. enterica serovar Montevideo]